MRNPLLRVLLVATALLWTAGIARAADSIRWEKSYSDAVESAKKSNKLIMVDFYTDWCGWCKKLDADTYTDKKVIALSEQIVTVKVDAEKEGVEQAKKYGVTGFPTILFLNTEGKLEGKIVGYQAAATFADSLTKFIGAHKEVPMLEAALAKNPKDGESAAKLAVFYAAQSDVEKTEAVLKTAEANSPKSAALPAAYNALADIYQEKQDFAKAIPLFRKAIKTGSDPKDLAYAHISIAFCYMEQQKTSDAIPELKATLAVPNVPADLKKQAQDVLKKLQGADKEE